MLGALEPVGGVNPDLVGGARHDAGRCLADLFGLFDGG